MYNRRRGTALVETNEGILVVCNSWDMDKKLFTLPGGKANKNESRRQAAIRELEEETSLKGLESTYLFSYNSPPHGHRYRDCHKVLLIKVNGTPEPQHEVKQIAFYKEGSDLNLSHSTREIIERFLATMKVPGISIAELRCPIDGSPLPPNLLFNHPFKCEYGGHTLVLNKQNNNILKVEVKK